MFPSYRISGLGAKNQEIRVAKNNKIFDKNFKKYFQDDKTQKKRGEKNREKMGQVFQVAGFPSYTLLLFPYIYQGLNPIVRPRR